MLKSEPINGVLIAGMGVKKALRPHLEWRTGRDLNLLGC